MKQIKVSQKARAWRRFQNFLDENAIPYKRTFKSERSYCWHTITLEYWIASSCSSGHCVHVFFNSRIPANFGKRRATSVLALVDGKKLRTWRECYTAVRLEFGKF